MSRFGKYGTLRTLRRQDRPNLWRLTSDRQRKLQFQFVIFTSCPIDRMIHAGGNVRDITNRFRYAPSPDSSIRSCLR